MISFLEQLVASLWNRLRRRERGTSSQKGTLDLGAVINDDATARTALLALPPNRIREIVKKYAPNALRRRGSPSSL